MSRESRVQEEDRKIPSRQDEAERLPTYSEDGVDLTLIRWMLQITPAQRLQSLQNCVNFITKLRNARSSR